MLFLKKITSTSVLILGLVAPAQAATTNVQMPMATFAEANNHHNWSPSTLERVLPAQSKVARSCGVASWYGIGDGFAGRRTASGSIFDPHAMTTAHRSLPFGTRIRVTNQSTGRSVVVTGTDRGPYVAGRVLDLSYGAFSRIADPGQGVVNVCYTRVN